MTLLPGRERGLGLAPGLVTAVELLAQPRALGSLGLEPGQLGLGLLPGLTFPRELQLRGLGGLARGGAVDGAEDRLGALPGHALGREPLGHGLGLGELVLQVGHLLLGLLAPLALFVELGLEGLDPTALGLEPLEPALDQPASLLLALELGSQRGELLLRPRRPAEHGLGLLQGGLDRRHPGAGGQGGPEALLELLGPGLGQLAVGPLLGQLALEVVKLGVTAAHLGQPSFGLGSGRALGGELGLELPEPGALALDPLELLAAPFELPAELMGRALLLGELAGEPQGAALEVGRGLLGPGGLLLELPLLLAQLFDGLVVGRPRPLEAAVHLDFLGVVQELLALGLQGQLGLDHAVVLQGGLLPSLAQVVLQLGDGDGPAVDLELEPGDLLVRGLLLLVQPLLEGSNLLGRDLRGRDRDRLRWGHDEGRGLEGLGEAGLHPVEGDLDHGEGVGLHGRGRAEGQEELGVLAALGQE